MEIRSDYNRYESSINNNPNINQTRPMKATNSIKRLLEAFYIELSPRARHSKEINDPSINYPVFNPDVLQYNSNLSLTYKS